MVDKQFLCLIPPGLNEYGDDSLCRNTGLRRIPDSDSEGEEMADAPAGNAANLEEQDAPPQGKPFASTSRVSEEPRSKFVFQKMVSLNRFLVNSTHSLATARYFSVSHSSETVEKSYSAPRGTR